MAIIRNNKPKKNAPTGKLVATGVIEAGKAVAIGVDKRIIKPKK